MLAVMNIFRSLFSDVFENKGLISRFKNSKFPVDIRHKYSYKFYIK